MSDQQSAISNKQSRKVFVNAQCTKELRNMIDELFELESGLKTSQIDYLDKMFYWQGCFTEGQASTITCIYREVMG